MNLFAFILVSNVTSRRWEQTKLINFSEIGKGNAIVRGENLFQVGEKFSISGSGKGRFVLLLSEITLEPMYVHVPFIDCAFTFCSSRFESLYPLGSPICTHEEKR